MNPTSDDPLFKKMKRQNVMYQILQVVTIVLVAGGFMLIFTMSTAQNTNRDAQDREILRSIQGQNQALQDAVNTLKRDNAEKLDEQERHLQCIARFFAETDRTQRVIEDLNSCLITNRGQPVSVTVPPLTVSDPPVGPLLALQEPAGVAPRNDRPEGDQPPQQPVASGDGPQPPNTATTPQMQPLTILGLPVCVPVLGVCVAR